MMKRRWVIRCRDAQGELIPHGELGRRWSRRAAERDARRWRATVWEPLPGRPLYTVHVDRLP